MSGNPHREKARGMSVSVLKGEISEGVSMTKAEGDTDSGE